MVEQMTISDAKPEKVESEDFSPRVTSPFLIGVFLGINAISDSYLVVDGPSCFPLKSPAIQGNHDWFAELVNVSGYDRCVTTHLHPSTVVLPHEDTTVSAVEEVARFEGTGGVFLTARPMAAITGVDYDRLAKQVRQKTDKPVVVVPPRSLSSNWLGGYAALMRALAEVIELPKASRKPDSVALVGYLWDRNEGDHEGNVAELHRLLEGLGLELDVVWLSGTRLEELTKVAQASAIISLPHGRGAARTLAERLGVPLVETVLPFGFERSERFVRDVAKAVGREEKGERLIEAELARAAPRLQWVVPFVFQGTRIGFVGDPNHLPGFCEMIQMMGARLAFAGLTGEERQVEDPPQLAGLHYEPRQSSLIELVREELDERGLDLLVTVNIGKNLPNVPQLEFGYPSYYTHCLVPRPFLGFTGTVAFVESMANTIRHAHLG